MLAPISAIDGITSIYFGLVNLHRLDEAQHHPILYIMDGSTHAHYMLYYSVRTPHELICTKLIITFLKPVQLHTDDMSIRP